MNRGKRIFFLVLLAVAGISGAGSGVIKIVKLGEIKGGVISLSMTVVIMVLGYLLLNREGQS